MIKPAMTKQAIVTSAAPSAIGTYSQGIVCGDSIYLSGQIPLDAHSGQLIEGPMRAQIERVLDNLAALAKAAGATLDDCVKLNVYLTDLSHFALVNEVMTGYFSQPYPARAALGVAALPRGATVEMDAILVRPV